MVGPCDKAAGERNQRSKLVATSRRARSELGGLKCDLRCGGVENCVWTYTFSFNKFLCTLRWGTFSHLGFWWTIETSWHQIGEAGIDVERTRGVAQEGTVAETIIPALCAINYEDCYYFGPSGLHSVRLQRPSTFNGEQLPERYGGNSSSVRAGRVRARARARARLKPEEKLR